jgi:hypothetical protein
MVCKLIKGEMLKMEINEIFSNIKSELLTEEVKTKISTLIEASVKEKSDAKIKQLEEKFESYKSQELSKLEERAVSYVDEFLVEKISDYFSHVAESYIEENRLEIDKGLKADLYEKLAEGVRNVLVKNAIPEGKAEVVETISADLQTVKSDLNKSLKENMELKKKIKGLRAVEIFGKLTESLSQSQKSRVQKLCEDFDVDNIEMFSNKVKTLVETVATSGAEKKAPIVETKKENPADKEASLNESVTFLNMHKKSEGKEIDDLKYL